MIVVAILILISASKETRESGADANRRSSITLSRILQVPPMMRLKYVGYNRLRNWGMAYGRSLRACKAHSNDTSACVFDVLQPV